MFAVENWSVRDMLLDDLVPKSDLILNYEYEEDNGDGTYTISLI